MCSTKQCIPADPHASCLTCCFGVFVTAELDEYCCADEHYVPTLLAYLGKDQETDCWGFLVNVDWSRGGAHPRTYAVEDLDAER